MKDESNEKDMRTKRLNSLEDESKNMKTQRLNTDELNKRAKNKNTRISSETQVVGKIVDDKNMIKLESTSNSNITLRPPKEYTKESNWFDKLCNFFSSLFGG